MWSLTLCSYNLSIFQLSLYLSIKEFIPHDTPSLCVASCSLFYKISCLLKVFKFSVVLPNRDPFLACSFGSLACASIVGIEFTLIIGFDFVCLLRLRALTSIY